MRSNPGKTTDMTTTAAAAAILATPPRHDHVGNDADGVAVSRHGRRNVLRARGGSTLMFVLTFEQ